MTDFHQPMQRAQARLISGERRQSVEEMRLNAARAANGFRSMGLSDGDSVAILMRNDFAFFEASLGAGLIGAYATPINWHFTADEVRYILQDCNAKVLVAHADLIPQLIGSIPAGVRLLVVATPAEIAAAYGLAVPAGFSCEGGADWDMWLTQHSSAAPDAGAPPASMVYTSGTTGRPKGVRRNRPTPEQRILSEQHAAIIYGLKADEPGVVLMNGPMYHSAPNAYGMLAARIGASIVLQARFDAEEMLDLIDRYRVTHMHIVPTMFVRLLRLPAEVRARYALSSLRHVVHGAAPCPIHVKRAMIDWWGPVICEYYGSTETGIPVWHNAEEALRKPGTVGRALHGCTAKVFDDAGDELAPGRVGEIHMRASFLPDFTYQGNAEKRQEIDRGGLVTVGDVGLIDEDGYIFLCDRKKDMIISGGVNIYPAEIEAVLIDMPGVKDCAVFGIPDEEFGESICAHIEVGEQGAVTAQEVRAHLASRLARFKVPRVIEFSAALPREDSGKIFKRKLRDPYWEKAGRSI